MSTRPTIADLWLSTYDQSQLEASSGQTFRPDSPDAEQLIDAAGSERPLTLGPLIGAGGQAEVYVARQATLSRDVAVKRVRDAGHERQLRMFHYEAQVTAGLNHPNILPIHDLVELDGRPALVMKRVMGSAWSDHLSQVHAAGTAVLAEEVRRLVDVCDAVAFAHSRGVLHLDIKPDNVMVGAFGETLVMDWGCARLFNATHWPEGQNLPRAERVRRPFGTPAFMAPEQARGDGAALGPRTDVYLLGAVLHYLLANRAPRWTDSVTTTVEAAARGDRGPLPEDAPTELASLCDKAMAIDPANRPAEVEIFREALAHWLATREARALANRALTKLAGLESSVPLSTAKRDEAVGLLGGLEQAGRLGAGLAEAIDGEQRLRVMLARDALMRNQAGLASALAGVLPTEHPLRQALLDDADACQARNADLQRASERERARSTAVKDFSQRMLSAVDPAVAQGLDNTLLRKMLEQSVADAEVAYAEQPLVLAEVLDTIGRTHLTLGSLDEALSILERASELQRLHLGAEDRQTLSTALQLIQVLRQKGNFTQASRRLIPCGRAVIDHFGRDHELYATWVVEQAEVAFARGDWKAAETRFQEALALWPPLDGAAGARTLATEGRLGEAYRSLGRFEEAEARLSHVLQAKERTLGPSHPQTLVAVESLGVLYGEMGRYPKAEVLLKRSVEGHRSVLGDGHPRTIGALTQQAVLSLLQRRFAEAQAVLEPTVEQSRRTLGADHPRTLDAMEALGAAYKNQDRRDRCEPLYRSVLEARQRVFGPTHPDTLKSMNNLGHLHLGRNEASTAQELFTAAWEGYQTLLGPHHPTPLSVLFNLALLHDRMGQTSKAEQHYIAVLVGRREVLGFEHPDTVRAEAYLEVFLRTHDRFDLVNTQLGSTLTGERLQDPVSPSTLEAEWAGVVVLRHRDRHEESEARRQGVLQRARVALGGRSPEHVQLRWLRYLGWTEPSEDGSDP